MEIEGSDGSKTLLKPGSNLEFGRGLGFNSNNRTVSRRQILFKLQENETKVDFEVIGRNPIWVYSKKNDKVEIFRKLENGEMVTGDMFCVSANKPIWFTLKRYDFDDEDKRGIEKDFEIETQLAESLKCSGGPIGVDLELERVDISSIDPVKEFGFLLLGHEFDNYPKRMIREIKNWNWFIEEKGAQSDADEESDEKGRKGARRKRKKKGEGDDEEWTGESEDEKELLTRSKKLPRPKYITRSKDKSAVKKNERSTQQKTKPSEEEYEEEEEDGDEDDETLGGFIVDDVEDEAEVGDDEEEAEVGDEEEEEESDADEDEELED